ncbi:hypothetical protein SAMN04488502_10985 [Dendrosporobacter quercicolus]|uniref:Uncharacterized protein n=2 Tax=Dendrosporobacter quercicolus TaxID=146817 RepID=A0A1G9XFK4_9FIRM|nr:hypothetical protein SAMN04488502_10985 [Dendrosporobacter quercicolus]
MNLVPRCKACNKLYKKNEANEFDLYPNCLSKQSDERQASEGADVAGTTIEEFTSKGELENEAESGINTADHLKPLKPGQTIRHRFLELVTQRRITAEVLGLLLDKDSTAKTLGIRYPFLKAYNPDVSIKEITYINGNARYSSNPVIVNGNQYLITNDLYAKNLTRFLEWADSLVDI